MENKEHNKFYCPMKCEGDKNYNEPGNCPVCNMHLISMGDDDHKHEHHHHGEHKPEHTYSSWDFFKRGWSSIRRWMPNMWTLISIGVGAAYIFSVFALLVPSVFPSQFSVLLPIHYD